MAISSERKERLRKKSLDVLLKNRRETDGYQYTVPSPSTYPYQWLWDSCFHAIVLAHFNIEDAKKEIRSVLVHQFDNGMIPHMVYWVPGELINIKWGKERTSSITQPPIIAQAVWEIYERDRDEAFLKEVYPKLYHFYRFLMTDRDPRRNNLIGIINPDESGEDNSSRFDIPLGLPPKHSLDENFQSRLKLVHQLESCNFDAPFCMKKFFWVKDVPFNAIMVKNLNILSKIAAHAGHPEDAAIFAADAKVIAEAMRSRMLEDGIYWPAYGEEYVKMKVKTWAIFSPIIAGLLSKDETQCLIDDHLLNKAEFGAPFLIPTVAQDEPSFDAQGFWRGPTWIATNWFIYRGLIDGGFIDIATRILESSAALLEQSGFREYFDPMTGAGLGAQEFTWGSLIVDMMEYAPPSTI